MLYITVMNLLTGMWLQMCQSRNAKLRVRRAPVAKLLSTKEPSENHEPLWVFCFLNWNIQLIKLSTEIKNTYVLSFSYLLLIRLLIFLSEIKAGLKTLLNIGAITNQSKWTHRKGKKKKSQSLSPWTLKFCEFRTLEKYSFTFLNHS